MGAFREFYIVEGHPIFLTFSQYGAMMQILQNNGKISPKETERADEFWPEKSQNRTVKDIERYLSELKKTDRDSFEHDWLLVNIEGKEAGKNISNFLSGVSNYYKTFHIDTSLSPYDIAYPFGKFFYFGASGKEEILEIAINTDEVDCIVGNIQLAFISFKTGGAIYINDGKCILIADNMAGKIDLSDYRKRCLQECGEIYSQKGNNMWFLKSFR